MKIYQLKTAKEFLQDPFWKKQNLTTEELMDVYASHVSKKFAVECANEALENKMEASNALHSKIDSMYNSIEW